MKPQRTFRPVIVSIPDGEPHAGIYEIHLGRPGNPKVYRRLSKGSLHRVSDDPRLAAVASWMKAGVRARQAAEAAKARQEASWRFRMGRKIRYYIQKIQAWFRRAPVARDINADLQGPIGV
jgi:hypothetical protein